MRETTEARAEATSAWIRDRVGWRHRYRPPPGGKAPKGTSEGKKGAGRTVLPATFRTCCDGRAPKASRPGPRGSILEFLEAPGWAGCQVGSSWRGDRMWKKMNWTRWSYWARKKEVKGPRLVRVRRRVGQARPSRTFVFPLLVGVFYLSPLSGGSSGEKEYRDTSL